MPLKDRTTRLESPRTLRDDAPNTYADNTPDSLQLQRERYHSGLTPRRRHPLEPVFNAAEIPGSFIRSGIHAFKNFNKPAYEPGGEPFLGTNILGQINNGENDPSFMNAQRIARPGVGLLGQSAIRLATDPGFVGNTPALYRGLGSAAKAVGSLMPRRRSGLEYGTIAELEARLRAFDLREPKPIGLGSLAFDDWYKGASQYTEAGTHMRDIPSFRPRTEHPDLRPVKPEWAGGKIPSNFDPILRFDVSPPRTFDEKNRRSFFRAFGYPEAKPLDPGNRLTPFWRKPPI